MASELRSLPIGITDLTQLEELDLTANQLTSLPLEFNNLTKLKVLKLFANLFREIPDLNRLINLRRLDLSRNRITSFNISGPAGLKMLDLSEQGGQGAHYSITNFDLSNLYELESLNLFGNNYAIPIVLTDLVNLKRLYLANANLNTLPEGLTNLTNLETLSLGGNQLTTPPDLSNF